MFNEKQAISRRKWTERFADEVWENSKPFFLCIYKTLNERLLRLLKLFCDTLSVMFYYSDIRLYFQAYQKTIERLEKELKQSKASVS